MRFACIALAVLVLRVAAAIAGPPLANPPELASRDGVLSGTLTVAPGEVVVRGKHLETTLYNGQYMPPVLRVQPGDRVQLHLANASRESTNIHYHGFTVTPQEGGDDAFVDVRPGMAFDYDFPIPPHHMVGLYWYHPHLHPMVNREIAGGLSGGIVMGDILAPFPELRGIVERIMLLKDLKVRHGVVVLDPDPSGKTIRTINGVLKPRIDIAPGELQFWRIGNIGANIFYRLKLPRHPFTVIGVDGRLQNQVVTTKELVIPPGGRYEVLVRGAKRGSYALRALPFDTGRGGDRYPGQRLATVVSSGAQVAAPVSVPTALPAVSDLRALPLTRERTVTFANAGTDLPDHFTIDDRIYDHNRIDTTVTLGDVEQWTVRNTSTELHVFHIHQTYFQVVAADGMPQAFVGYQDTVTLPAATRRAGVVGPLVQFEPVVAGIARA